MSGQGTSDAVQRYFERVMELSPVEATYYGLHQHDHRLPDGGVAAAEERGELLARLEAELGQAEVASLDHDIARFYAGLSRFHHEELRLWARMADAPEVIGSAIFLLFSRDFAPLEDRLESIAARLEAAPAYLRSSRERLLEPVRLWNQTAAEAARHLPGLIGLVVAAAPPGTLRTRLEAAAAPASSAALEFAEWLEREVVPRSTDAWALGEERFTRLLELRRLPLGPGAIRDLGSRYLAEVKAERAELLSRHWPGRSIEEVNEELRSRHPESFEAALDEYRETISRSREFVAARGLATLPTDEELRVEETPGFLRPLIPFAAYEPPAFFDDHQLGIYIVTRQDGDLGEHNQASILNTSVHEGYPGHHLQFATANRNRSLARLLNAEHATELIEGWAHYCEQLMHEEGFSGGHEIRFVQLNDLVWRACRVIIDVELSSGRMGFEEAVRMLTSEAAMTQVAAEAEVKRYTFTPGYQLSYLYGKHLLLELRDRRRLAEGAGFQLRRFHDTLLSASAVPAAMWDRLF
jgi:uncharacterized protein (DUF885 family)